MRVMTLLLVWSWCALAAARAPRRIALHYTRALDAQGCVDPATLARKVEAFTGPVLVAPSQAEATLEVHVRGEHHGFQAQLQLSGASQGERSLQHASADCAGFTDTLAFVIATTIDPDLVLEQVGAIFATEQPPERTLLSELERAPPVPAKPAPPRVVVPVVPAPVPKPRAWQPSWSAGLALGDEAIFFGAGVTAAARLAVGRWLAFVVPIRATLSRLQGDVDVRTASLGAELLGCARRGARFTVALCAGPTVSGLHARGLAATGSQAGWSWTGGVQLRPELTVTLRRRVALVAAPFVSYLAHERSIVSGQDELARSAHFVFGATLEARRDL